VCLFRHLSKELIEYIDCFLPDYFPVTSDKFGGISNKGGGAIRVLDPVDLTKSRQFHNFSKSGGGEKAQQICNIHIYIYIYLNDSIEIEPTLDERVCE
jgi:hypothetical protein